METISISPLNPKDVYAQIPTISKIRTLHKGRYWGKDIETWEVREENGKMFVVKTVEWSGLVFENGVNMYKDYKKEIMFSISTLNDFEIWLKTREILSYEAKPQETKIQGEVSTSVTEVLEGAKNMLNWGKRIDRDFLRSYVPQIGDKITFWSLTESRKIFFTYEVEWVRAWVKKWEIKVRFLNKSEGKERVGIYDGNTSEFLRKFVHWWNVRIERNGYKNEAEVRNSQEILAKKAFQDSLESLIIFENSLGVWELFKSGYQPKKWDIFFWEMVEGGEWKKFTLRIMSFEEGICRWQLEYTEDNITVIRNIEYQGIQDMNQKFSEMLISRYENEFSYKPKKWDKFENKERTYTVIVTDILENGEIIEYAKGVGCLGNIDNFPREKMSRHTFLSFIKSIYAMDVVFVENNER